MSYYTLIIGNLQYDSNNPNTNNFMTNIIIFIAAIPILITYISLIFYIVNAIEYYTHEKFKNELLHIYILLLCCHVYISQISYNKNNKKFTDDINQIITKYMDEVTKIEYTFNFEIIFDFIQLVIGTILTNTYIHKSNKILIKIFLISSTISYYIFTFVEFNRYPNIIWKINELKTYNKREI
jgi:hypothetical protein